MLARLNANEEMRDGSTSAYSNDHASRASIVLTNVIHLFIEQTPLLNTSYISINIHLQGLLYHADPIP